MAFTAGQKVRASELNSLGNVVGRNTRTTDFTSSSGGTAVRALSVRAPVVNGRTYEVTSWQDVYAATSGAVVQLHWRYTTDDTEPGVGVTVYAAPRVDVVCVTSSQLYPTFSRGLFDAGYTGFLRVAMTIVRSSGSGNISIGAGSINPCTLVIRDVGETLASSGTVY